MTNSTVFFRDLKMGNVVTGIPEHAGNWKVVNIVHNVCGNRGIGEGYVVFQSRRTRVTLYSIDIRDAGGIQLVREY